MKKAIKFKEVMLKATVVITLMVIASCSSNPNPKDSKTVAEKQNKEKFDDNKQEKDAQFLVYAAEINLEQIQLAKLAQQKGKNADIRNLGKMVEVAHIKSQVELSILAKTKGVHIPQSISDDSKEAYEDLNKKSENDFDKAYADKMVSNHKDAINIFEDAFTDRHDTEIKSWAKASLVHLRAHHEHSVECQKKLE
jgi:putative membrane protein